VRIGIHGAGAIGCYVGGALAAALDEPPVLVGRAALVDELGAHGLTLIDLDGAPRPVPAGRYRLATDVAALAGCDRVLVCVKSAQTEEAGRALAGVLGPDATVASLQNAVPNAEVLRRVLGARQVLPTVVGFNVVARGGGVFHRATSGPLMIEAGDDGLVGALAAAGLDVEVRADLAPDQWTKLLVNLNNAVSALSGAPTRSILLSPGYRRVVAAVVDEAVRVLRAAGIRPAKLRGVPVHLMPRVMRLPTPLVRLVTRAQMKVDPEARSSMWQDLSRRRPTEVDHLNGEIVRLAEAHGLDAPLNRRICELVHAAERAGAGSPDLDADALWARLTG
jgi:2-dehydropantoate 2-reductase